MKKNASAAISAAVFIIMLFIYLHVSRSVSVFINQKATPRVVELSDVTNFLWLNSSDARPACASKVRISLLTGGRILVNNVDTTGGGSMRQKNGQHSCDPSELVTIELRDSGDKDKKVIQMNKVENNAVSCPREPLASPVDLPKTGLLSHPGSGNTWTRHLLQQLTGIQTGAVYRDRQLLNNGFPGEGRRDGVIAIKSHSMHRLQNIHNRQILVIRNPYESFLAEYKRGVLRLGHTRDAVIVPDENWKKYVQKKMSKWVGFIRQCLDFPYDQHIIIYEDLKNCLDRELLFLALFLKTENLTQFSLCCVLSNNEGEHHRQSSGQSSSIYDLYDQTLRQQMNEMLTKVAKETEPRLPVLAKRILAYKFYD